MMAYYLNRKKIFIRSGNVLITSFFEGLGTYLIIIAVILEGFIVNPVLQVFLLILGLLILAYTNNNINDTEPEMDVQIETMKNLIVIYASTILLFFVMLSIFRFQHFMLQFFYALLVVFLFNFFGFFLKKWFSKIWDRMNYNHSMLVTFNAIYIYVLVFLMFFVVVFFNFPKVSVNKIFNLNNSNAYFAIPDGAVDLVNRYKIDQLIDLEMEIDMDENAYINQSEDHVFIHIRDTLIVYDLRQEKMIYSGIFKDNVDGIEISSINKESNEIKLKSYCSEDSNCQEYDYPYEYGDVEYKTQNAIIKFEQLTYEETDTAIFNEEILHLFKDEEIDSRVSTSKDRPFLGFNESKAVVTDIDNYGGTIYYLQVEENDKQIYINVNKIIENDIDLPLPFYGHYRFGILVFIFILGFIPISNYDDYRIEV